MPKASASAPQVRHLPLEPQGDVPLTLPWPDAPQDRGEGSVRNRTGSPDPLDFRGLLGSPICLEPTRSVDQFNGRLGSRELPPELVAQEPRLDCHASCTETLENPGPDHREVVCRLLDPGRRRLRSRLESVAAVGQHDHVFRRDKELAGMPGHSVLAVIEREPGDIPHVLRPNAKVGIHTVGGHPGAQPGKSRGPCRRVCCGPPGPVGIARGWRKVGRMRQVPNEIAHAAMLAARRRPRPSPGLLDVAVLL